MSGCQKCLRWKRPRLPAPTAASSKASEGLGEAGKLEAKWQVGSNTPRGEGPEASAPANHQSQGKFGYWGLPVPISGASLALCWGD